jgi:hypothetical protein
VTLDLRGSVAVADLGISLGLVGLFVLWPSGLVMLDETLIRWRYDAFDGAVTKRSARLVMDGPPETVCEYGNPGPAMTQRASPPPGTATLL